MVEQINLCDICLYERESCNAKRLSYGSRGIILKCDAHEGDGSPAPPEPAPVPKKEKPVPVIKEVAPPVVSKEVGKCMACSKPLITIQVNSRVRGLVCKNRRCNLYYQRIKTYSIPLPLPVIKDGEYWCTLCRSPHRLTSKQGKKHLEYRKENKDANGKD